MTADPKLDTKAAIIAHLESLAVANNMAIRNRDFSSIENMTFNKPLPRFADEAPGQRFTATEAFYLAKNLCQTYPEYDPKIIEMVTTLGDSKPSASGGSSSESEDDLKSITKAQTFFTYERAGIPPGTITSSVMIVRYRCNHGHWAIESYERMPGGNMFGGTGYL